MQFKQTTLANGLEVIAECNDDAYSTGVAFYVKTGARDETGGIAGVSHFLEHMAFKGTPTRSADEVNQQFDAIGSQANAFTSEELTVYHATALPEYQLQLVEIIADILRPSLRDDDFETEKKVIIEEIRMYDDQPPFGAHEKAMAAYFGDHPLGQSILGSEATVQGLTPAAMHAYFQHRYSPGNIVLAAAGRVDFDALAAAAEKFCGHWEPFATHREAQLAQPRSEFRSYHKEAAEQQYTLLLSPGPAAEDSDRYAAGILETIMGDDTGSRFFWEFIDTGLAEYAAMWSQDFERAGLMNVYLSCPPELAAQNIERVMELLHEVEKSGITADELERTKTKICSHMVLRSERPRSRLFNVGGNWVQRREYLSTAEVVAAFQAVTLDDVHDLLIKYPLSNPTVVSVGPLEELSRPV